MPRFFVGRVEGQSAVIEGEDARHIALALRMKTGEMLTVCDSAGQDYQCVIRRIQPDRVELQVQAVEPSAGEPGVWITLYQALPKGDKMETIIQKSVELGVGRIVPVLTRRCVSRPDPKALAKKLERWNRIALEAAKQCGRGRVPPVEGLVDFREAVQQMKAAPLGIFFYENAATPLKPLLERSPLAETAVLIGSEGGFEPSEAAYAQENGLHCCSLGSRILRCETAPLAAITAILYQAGDI